MGTRADFYVGRGKNAEWLGSVAMGGYPDGFCRDGLLNAASEEQFREAVAAEISSRDDGTTPEQGWPWPWSDSHTTDYAYAFDAGEVFGSAFGGGWFCAADAAEDPEAEEIPADGAPVEFPDMSERKNVTFGQRSGLITISS